MEILDEENNQVNLDNINISSPPPFNSKYDPPPPPPPANIDLTVLLRDKI